MATRFHPGLDNVLLREVVAATPYALPVQDRTGKWEALVQRINCNEGTKITTRAAKDRFRVLLRAFKQGEMKSLKASGTEEAYGERDILLTEIVGMMEESNRVDKEKKDRAAEEKRKEQQGKEIREAAMQSLKRPTSSNDEPRPKKKTTSSSNVNDYLELRREQLELEKQKFELEKREREARMEHDASMLALLQKLTDRKSEE